ncbi:tRNA(Ile)-lysidine synthase [Thermoanaerobacter thermohydrosulfuricus]|uniref:tRNA(Ile)-lysidine synthase n=2 Tax=Thermoanaerobacter thermohydrosulfuricus TaxID=1516 RepID=M8DR06_THETY|nr:tRNA lysidine(34) synthetase TilS [Thermoanaerobacter thermohydrosulfuricus]EMT38946.1 tRNA(Ile)-lysidine synthetase, N-terminal domain/tRNA(Ile)-lysidine synthetase [Thermoanaerobacter thermohydrosulfuricus WC1]SDF36538.1 tRNA(Ile)-lysidine synthase [Thermoanaerobacter thermohydrosulfuricus]
MIDKVISTIKRYKMIEANDKIVMGVSGGPDSLCMLDILYNLKDLFNLKLYVVHVNHMIRGEEAKRDAQFVEDMCRKLKLPFFLFEKDVKKIAKEMGYSEEEAGRYVRYQAFEEVLREVKGNKIAVAHNKNDVVETVFLNLIRGSGMAGLIGIKPVNGNIIRPLIEIKREEIEKYLKEKGLKPVVDFTNYEDLYKRNKVRLKLIPFINETFEVDIIENIYRMAKIILEENDYLEKECEKIFNEACYFNQEEIFADIKKLRAQHPAIQRRLVRLMYQKLKGDIYGLEYIHVEDVLSLLDKPTSSKIDLPFEIEALKSYNNLIMRKVKEKEAKTFWAKLNIPGITKICGVGQFKTSVLGIEEIKKLNIGKYTKFFDYDKIQEDVVVRNRQAGDIFSPLNLGGSKKLKEFFIDEKIPREIRDSIPLLAIDNEIVWVVGYRMSDKFKVDENTKNVLVIEYTKV